MHVRYSGDSYDIVKQSLIRVLQPETWCAFPMFTEECEPEEAAAYGNLLGCTVLSNEPFLAKRNSRDTYFEVARKCDKNLFLDPDTGLRLDDSNKHKAENYVYGSELISIANARPKHLTMVFDQSLARGDKMAIQKKVEFLNHAGITCFVYCSHACFIILGTDEGKVDSARQQVLQGLRIPEFRLVPPYPPEKEVSELSAKASTSNGA